MSFNAKKNQRDKLLAIDIKENLKENDTTYFCR